MAKSNSESRRKKELEEKKAKKRGYYKIKY